MKRIAPIILIVTLMCSAKTAGAQDVSDLPLVTTAKHVDIESDEREIRDEERHLRFCVKKDWDVKFGAGIWILTSSDKKILTVVTLLDDPKEIPSAIEELDKLVGVQRTEFGKAKPGFHRGIPTEVLSGRGVLTKSNREVSVNVLTMFVYEAPVLVLALVHADAVKEKAPTMTRFFKSFALLVSPEEAEALEARSKRVDPSLLK